LVKTLLSILLGLMLLTSLLGITYATPIGNLQPTQAPNYNNCNLQQPPNAMSMNVTQVCPHYNDGGNGGRDPHGCLTGEKAPDTGCCLGSITPNGLEVSDIHPDTCVFG
jgi:hypothetical protein